MKIVIEIPVEVDGQLTAAERRELMEHLEKGVEPELKYLRLRFQPGSRMLAAICRFGFGEIRARVEK